MKSHRQTVKPWHHIGFSRYGASMGRHGNPTGDLSNPLHLQQVRLDSGGYDQGGAYWGHDVQLWCAWNNEFETYVRASNRKAAMALIAERHPEAVFLRGAPLDNGL